jgi:hypothetical protein
MANNLTASGVIRRSLDMVLSLAAGAAQGNHAAGAEQRDKFRRTE